MRAKLVNKETSMLEDLLAKDYKLKLELSELGIKVKKEENIKELYNRKLKEQKQIDKLIKDILDKEEKLMKYRELDWRDKIMNNKLDLKFTGVSRDKGRRVVCYTLNNGDRRKRVLKSSHIEKRDIDSVLILNSLKDFILDESMVYPLLAVLDSNNSPFINDELEFIIKLYNKTFDYSQEKLTKIEINNSEIKCMLDDLYIRLSDLLFDKEIVTKKEMSEDKLLNLHYDEDFKDTVRESFKIEDELNTEYLSNLVLFYLYFYKTPRINTFIETKRPLLNTSDIKQQFKIEEEHEKLFYYRRLNDGCMNNFSAMSSSFGNLFK